MEKKFLKPFIVLFILSILFTCTDPYVPKVDKFQSLLVVDAQLTDENISNTVRLSHTTETANDDPVNVSNALVIIRDDKGNSITLPEVSAGTYKTDSLAFKGEAGRTYTLYIKTSDGKEYESEPCLLQPAQDIDSLYFNKDYETAGGETQEGIRIYINSKGESQAQFYRWTYEEWWKFTVPYPQEYDFINDTTVYQRSQVNQTCWGNHKSGEVIINSVKAEKSGRFEKAPILFLATDATNRFTIQYYIKVRQLSITEKEYEFWNNMSQINESGGDIFDKQPFQITGNLHSITQPDEDVLGYFQVSGAKSKGIFITNEEVIKLGVPVFSYGCPKFAREPKDYPMPAFGGQPYTFEEIYTGLIDQGYAFVRPVLTASGQILKLEFTDPYCADCTLNGKLKKPDFWIDLK